MGAFTKKNEKMWEKTRLRSSVSNFILTDFGQIKKGLVVFDLSLGQMLHGQMSM